MNTKIVFFVTIIFLPNVYCLSNIMVILTDDQDLLLNGLEPMKKLQKYIANEGTVFSNAFVNSPICCPSRSTILTGKYLHNTGVKNNSIAGNCNGLNWRQNLEKNTIATYLKNGANYTTFYAGKYLNQYGTSKTGGTKHIPPGYDWWIGLKGNSKYYNYTLSINGTKKEYKNEYLTDVLTNYSLSFLNNRNTDNPFFMMIAPPAPHAPFTAAERHKNTFRNVKALRTPNFNKPNFYKHWLVNMQPSPLPEPLTLLDDIQRKRWQSLLAVDDMIESLILKLSELNILQNTYIIFTSDNGFHIGQFSLPWDKRQPYETDIKVPFMMRGPKIPKKSIFELPSATVDIAPSLLTLANLPVPIDMDGISFIESTNLQLAEVTRKNILIEYHGEYDTNSVSPECPWQYDKNLTECSTDSWCRCQDSKNNTYTCILDFSSQDSNIKFCQFQDNNDFIEVYNIHADPYELNNIYTWLDKKTITKYQKLITNMISCVGRTCY